MPTNDEIDAWDSALEELRLGHENVKATIGKPAEAGARLAYNALRERYERAANALS